MRLLVFSNGASKLKVLIFLLDLSAGSSGRASSLGLGGTCAGQVLTAGVNTSASPCDC